MANSIKPAVDQAIKQIERIDKAMLDLDKTIAKTSKNARENLQGAFSPKVPSDVNDALLKSSKAIQQLNKDLEKQKQLNIQLQKARQGGNKTLTEEERLQRKLLVSERALTDARSKEGKEIQKNRVEASRLNKESRRETILTNNLIGAYQKLNLRRTEASRKLIDLIASEKASNREIRKAQREFDKLDKRIRKANGAIKSGTLDIGRYKIALGGARMNALRFASALGFTGVLFGLARGFKEAINTIREFDAQLIAVGKTTGLEGEALADLAQKTVDLGLKLKGISIQGLLQTAEVAGQLGIKGTENILKFSEAVETLKSTGDIASQETVRAFAQFIGISKDTAKNADRLASVITILGNNLKTTESAIVDVAIEVQKGLQLFNVSAESALGLAGSLSEMGVKSAAARTSLLKTFRVIQQSIFTGENLNAVLKLTGLTEKELAKQFNEDATGVFLKFLKGLKDIKDSGGNVDKVLKDMKLSGDRVSPTISTMAVSFDKVAKATGMAEQEYIDNKAATEELEASTKSLNSIIGDAKDAWDAFVLSIDKGDGVISKFLRTSAKGLTNFVEGLISLNTTAAQKGINSANNLVNAFKSNTEVTTAETANFIKRTISEADKNIVILQARVDKANKRAASLGIIARPQVKRANEDLEKEISIRNELQKILVKEQEAKSKVNEETKKEITITESATKAVDKNKKGIKSVKDETKKLIKVFEDFQDEGIGVTELVKDLVFGWDEYASLNNEERLKKEKEALDLLTQSLNDFLSTFSEGFLSDAGLGSLNQFFDFDGDGLSTFDKILEGAEDFKGKAAVIFTSVAEVAQEAFSFIEQAQANSIAKQLDDVNKQREIEISLAGGNAEAIANINAQADLQEREIKKKQAEQNKKNAIFNIAINTAQGIVAALASVPPNVPLSIAIGVIGALQAALVSSTPIPQFAEGVENSTYSGAALMGEVRPEIQEKKDGSLFLIDKPTIGHVDKGDTIHKSIPDFTKNFFNYGDINKAAIMMSLEANGGHLNSANVAGMQDMSPGAKMGVSAVEMDRIFEKNMRKMTALNLSMDQNGFAMSLQKGLSRTAIKRNRVTFKGKKV